VPAEEETPAERHLALEAILAFPELRRTTLTTMPCLSFFSRWPPIRPACSNAGCASRQPGPTMARWRARSIITYRAIRTFEPEFKDEDCSDLNAIDRARVQMIYIPATRDGASQVSSYNPSC
jgi:putative ATP-dependent endonuclease of the OLD family